MNQSGDNPADKSLEHEIPGGQASTAEDAPAAAPADDSARSALLIDSLRTLPVAGAVGLAVLCAVFFGLVLLNLAQLFASGDSAGMPADSFYWVLVIGLLLITAVSLGISFWMYYIRSVDVVGGAALVPEKWAAVIDELIRLFKRSHKQSEKSRRRSDMILAKVLVESEHQSRKSESLLDGFLTMQKALDTRDAEIARLKKGYDAKIFKRFLMRFIRVDSALKEICGEAGDGAESRNYRRVSRLLEDALEECGVEQFSPEIGSDYREAGSRVAEEPLVSPTDDAEQDFKIASVKSVGYILEGEGETEVIVPAKVSIYRLGVKKEEAS